VIDHVEAHATGGATDEANLATACNKCNARKNAGIASDFQKKWPGRSVKGRYGEPRHWDGLASLFVVLAADDPALAPGERAWQRALTEYLAARGETT
jgi:hypothetical protein